MKKIILALFCIISIEANAQNGAKKLGDTIKRDLLTAPDTVKHLHSKAWTLVPPAVLITYGFLSFNVTPIRSFDYYVQSETRKTDPTFHSVAESYFQFAPVAAVYVLNLAGIEGKNRFIDRTALLGVSGAILGGIDYGLKHSTHRLRPNGENYLSFPSGHTSTAFLGAEFMAQEYSGKSAWYGVAAYAVATATGVFRLYNRDHWFSDVVAGAGFGIISTKAAYLIYPYVRNALTRKDKNGKSTLIMPTYQDGAVQIAFTKEL